MTHPADALRLVPVEPTREMIEAGASREWSATYNTPEWKAADRDLKADYRKQAKLTFKAMLSAAPASPLPEGGGDWSAIRNVFVRHAEAFVKASRYEEASAIADKAAREIQGLMSPLPAAPTGAK